VNAIDMTSPIPKKAKKSEDDFLTVTATQEELDFIKMLDQVENTTLSEEKGLSSSEDEKS